MNNKSRTLIEACENFSMAVQDLIRASGVIEALTIILDGLARGLNWITRRLQQ